MARRSTGIALALALVLPALLAPRRARADGPSPAPPERGQQVNDTAADATSAQEHYSAGRESYRAGSYAKALDYFERSLALVPSPNTRLYLARTLRELGRSNEAAEQYRATIREAEARGGKYVATRDAADMELRELKVPADRSDPAAKTTATIPAERSHEELAPIAVTAPSAAPAPAPGGPSTLTWVSGGVAVAGTISFAVLYALAGDRYGYLEDNCTRVRDAACDGARSTGKSEEVVAYVSLGVAAAAAAVAVVSLVLHPSSSSARGSAPWRLTF